MPRPARYDKLPHSTGLINWESLGSSIEGTDAELASTVEDPSLPILGTNSLPLPRGILDAANRSKLSQDAYQKQDFVEPLSNPTAAALETFPNQYMEISSDTISALGPSGDQSVSGRLQQCQYALKSFGFPSVDAFALEYYTACLGPLPQRLGVEQREGLTTLDRLFMLLQNKLPPVYAMKAGNLHQDNAQSARNIYVAELRNIDYRRYDPDKPEEQVSEAIQHAVNIDG